MNRIDEIIIEHIKEYIFAELSDKEYDDYDSFYDELWSVQDSTLVYDIMPELKENNLDKMEYCCEMLVRIHQEYGITWFGGDESIPNYKVDSIIRNYMCIMVSENGDMFYEEYKKKVNEQKIIETPEPVVDECCICYENKTLETTVCNHNFCNDSLFRLKNCAMCRKQLVEIIKDIEDDENE